MTALALAKFSFDLGYVRDATGLLLHTRDPDPRDRQSPLFHLVRTVEGNRWLLSAALTEAQRATLEVALRSEAVLPSLERLEDQPPAIEGAVARLLDLTEPLEVYRGPAFVFPATIPAPSVEVALIEDPRELVTTPALAWIREATPAAHPLCVARNLHGEVVAVCHSSRSTSTAAAAGVETDEAYRGHGLGTGVVAGWAVAVRSESREPFYGTTWTNLASRAIARKLRLVLFGEDIHPA